MAKERKAVPAKRRALLQQEIDSRCPFCPSGDVGHFILHHIDEDPTNNDPRNLLMMCPTCHSKVTKGDISSCEVLGVKTTILKFQQMQTVATPPNGPSFYGNVSQSVVGNGNQVTYSVKTNKRPKYPPGCIGSDVTKANYVSYLIDRYHEYKEWEVGKDKMRYGLFPSQMKKKYHIGKQRTLYNLPLSKFEELVADIQNRIAGTALAKINAAKDQNRHFQSFDAYLAENG